jgi:hypothetical protein
MNEQIQKLKDKTAALEWLEKHGSRHTVTCPLEDPESYAPCNCGATSNKRIINFLSNLVLNS